ncbi:MAG: BMC domain-containing protein [Actinobacteria bacterium]|nr:BMC domain-containing protein [Actinomycetota bacterium]
MEKSIGIVEFRSIAVGIDAVDKIVKASEVVIFDARTICPGKYYIIFSGLVSAVKNSMSIIEEGCSTFIIDSVVIPNVYPRIFSAVSGTSEIKSFKSIGVIETLTSPSIFWSADAAVKATEVDIVEIRVARAIGGKNICIINGELSDVSESVRVGIQYPEEKGFLVNYEVIAAPHPDLYRAVM